MTCRRRVAGQLRGNGITQHTGTHGSLAAGTDTEAAATPASAAESSATDLRGAALRLFALSRDPMATAGFDGYIKHANPTWEDLLGWTMADLRSRPYLEFVHADLNANCCITKPVDLDEFISVVRSIEDFWLSFVRLPPQ